MSKVIGLNGNNEGIFMTDRQKKIYEKIEEKLNDYLNSFYKVCNFNEETLDWSDDTQKSFNYFKNKWIRWCKINGYADTPFAKAFHWDGLLLKTDLIIRVKYGAEADKEELIKLLKGGKTPKEVADYAKENLKLEKI